MSCCMRVFRQRLRRTVAFYRMRRKFRALREALGASVVVWPILVALALHFFLGVRVLTLLVVGGLATAVGCVFFLTKEDEYLVGLWIGFSVLIAVLICYLIERTRFVL